MISQSDFWTNFLANISADIIIAVAIYIALTRPIEKRETEARIKQALGMLKSEMIINSERAESHLKILNGSVTEYTKLSTLRYTRGVWNALKESGFLPQLKDPALVYHILRANEAIVIAEKSLHNFIIADRDQKPTQSLSMRAAADNQVLIEVIKPLINLLQKMDLPEFRGNDLYESEPPNS